MDNLLADKLTTRPAYTYDEFFRVKVITLYNSKLDGVSTIVTGWPSRCRKTKYKATIKNVASMMGIARLEESIEVIKCTTDS